MLSGKPNHILPKSSVSSEEALASRWAASTAAVVVLGAICASHHGITRYKCLLNSEPNLSCTFRMYQTPTEGMHVLSVESLS